MLELLRCLVSAEARPGLLGRRAGPVTGDLGLQELGTRDPALAIPAATALGGYKGESFKQSSKIS